MFSAPRVWWTLQAFGHKSVGVLNGGLPAWKRAGGELQTGSPKEYKIRKYPVPELEQRLVRSFEDVTHLVEHRDRSVQIIDARSEERLADFSSVLIIFRFFGRAPEPRPGLFQCPVLSLMKRHRIRPYTGIVIHPVSEGY